MRVAMFEGYGSPSGQGPTVHVRLRRRIFATGAFGALSPSQLEMADDALAAAERGRSWYEVWAPSIDELKAMRGWLGDERVGLATFNVYLQKARDAMGTSEWDAFIGRWPSQVTAAQEAYDTATERPIVPPFLDPFASAGKWIVVGLVAYAAIRIVAKVPDAAPQRRTFAGKR